MRKEIFIHLFSLLIFFSLITVFRGWFEVNYWTFWVGGLLGTFLPDVDHLIYVYFLSPQELTSQRVNFSLAKRDLVKSIQLLYDTRRERLGLIFHTAYFQVIFLLLMFFVATSTDSLFGRGLVLSFFLHLLVDQLLDHTEGGGAQNWFRGVLANFEGSKKRLYYLTIIAAFLVISFFF